MWTFIALMSTFHQPTRAVPRIANKRQSAVCHLTISAGADAADPNMAEILNAGEDTEFEDAEGAGLEESEDDDDMGEEDMLDEEEIAEALEAEEGQLQLQVIDEQAFQEVVNDLAVSDPASAAALR